jgi:protein phosphatase 2C-like protein
MRFHADHAFHIGLQHVRSGTCCQDYAISGNSAESTYVIVSDGCSSGGHTDVGARVVAHVTAGRLQRDGSLVGPSFDASCFETDRRVASSLGLSNEDLLATCVYAKAVPALKTIQVRIVGDGVIARRTRGGDIWMARVDWANNTPFYRAYFADGCAQFFAAQSGDTPIAVTVHHRSSFGADDTSVSHGIEAMHSLEFRIPEVGDPEDPNATTEVAIFSDGVTLVDGMDWRDVVCSLLSFKSTEGSFVKRRMSRFLKDCQAHGKGPIDDIAMAAIHIEREDAS